MSPIKLITATSSSKTIQKKLEKVEETLQEYFPGASFYVKACLSVVAQLHVEDITNPFPLVLLGDPSTKKTTYLSFFYGIQNLTYKTDKFTPKSFVSHASNVSREKLEQIDLLPRIKDKVLITPELAPIFGARYEDLLENIAILTRVLDGQGFTSDSGVHGSRGYEGEYMFCWLGAIVDIPPRARKILGNLGSRLYFLRIPKQVKSENSLAKQLTENPPYLEKVKICRKAVQEFVLKLRQAYPSKVKWSNKDSEDALKTISRTALLLSKLRATINLESKTGGIVFSKPVIEAPDRANQMLYNLARGHALIHGRTYVTNADSRVVLKVALSSAPKERLAILDLLLRNKGIASTSMVLKELKCSRDTALRLMKELALLEVADLVNIKDDKGRPEKVLKLKSDFEWIKEEGWLNQMQEKQSDNSIDLNL